MSLFLFKNFQWLSTAQETQLQFSNPKFKILHHVSRAAVSPWLPTADLCFGQMVYLLFSAHGWLLLVPFPGSELMLPPVICKTSFTVQSLESNDTIFLRLSLLFLPRYEPPMGFGLTLFKAFINLFSVLQLSVYMSYSSTKLLAP